MRFDHGPGARERSIARNKLENRLMQVLTEESEPLALTRLAKAIRPLLEEFIADGAEAAIRPLLEEFIADGVEAIRPLLEESIADGDVERVPHGRTGRFKLSDAYREFLREEDDLEEYGKKIKGWPLATRLDEVKRILSTRPVHNRRIEHRFDEAGFNAREALVRRGRLRIQALLGAETDEDHPHADELAERARRAELPTKAVREEDDVHERMEWPFGAQAATMWLALCPLFCSACVVAAEKEIELVTAGITEELRQTVEGLDLTSRKLLGALSREPHREFAISEWWDAAGLSVEHDHWTGGGNRARIRKIRDLGVCVMRGGRGNGSRYSGTSLLALVMGNQPGLSQP